MNIHDVVIDASMSLQDGITFCLCPVELNGHGKISEVVIGLSIICGSLPPENRILGIYHPDGPDAARKWLRANLAAVAHFCSCGNPELGEGSVGLAALGLFAENHPDDLKPIFGIDGLREALTLQYGVPLP